MGAQVAPGEWQAQGWGDSAKGREAGLGAPRGARSSRLSEVTLLTLLIFRTGRLAGARSRGDRNTCPASALPWGAPAGLRLPSRLSPCPRRWVPAGSPALSSLGSGRDRPAARAQLRTLGGLEDLRGFPRGTLASSCSPLAGGLAVPCSARSAGRPDGPAQGHGTAPRPALPVTGFQARRGRGWGSSLGGRQPVRATCRRGSWSPALCSVLPGDEALLSLRWWGWGWGGGLSTSSPF